MLGVAVEWLLRLPDDRGMASILGISNQQRFVLLYYLGIYHITASELCLRPCSYALTVNVT
jgi:hypothetical protein